MANRSLFSSFFRTRRTDATNLAGGRAYAMTPKHALAQFAATGCMNATFYADAESQLATMIALARSVEPEFVAKVALYTRQRSHMKDAPAVLVAVLSTMSPGLMAEVFDRVIDSPRMLRTFVQVMRSGQVGRTSLGTLPKRLVQQWFDARTDEQLLRGSVGANPSMGDLVRMTHPKPTNPQRSAMLAYLINKPYEVAQLPECVLRYEAFRANPRMFGDADLPDLPFEMLAGLSLEPRHWRQLAMRLSWQALRSNLNTLARQRVFDDASMIQRVAERLRDPALIAKARVMPYQILAAYTNAGDGVPGAVRDALHDAMEIAIGNVPRIEGTVWIFPDVSGSMHNPVTGQRGSASSKVRCVDVAALIAASILRTNPQARVVPFSDSLPRIELEPRDTVLTNAKRLASLPAGGTNCALPLARLNRIGAGGDLVVYVSDNESWIDTGRGVETDTLREWRAFKRWNPHARMVCIDLTPNRTTQAPENVDVLNVGGFSDAVFDVIANFVTSGHDNNHWVNVIEREVL